MWVMRGGAALVGGFYEAGAVFHATILYLLGIDHTKLTYRYSGRDFRLTDIAGNVIRDIVA